jgi:CRP-like cAMP-binding protein
MSTIATLRVPVSPIALPQKRTYYLHGKLPVVWTPQEPKPIVKRANLFLQSLPPACRENMDPYLRTVDLEQEDYLWGQDETPECVYFPETAVISHIKMLANGEMVEIALTGREGSTGMFSVFGSGVSASSAQVAHAGLAAKIEREVLVKMVRLYPELVPFMLSDVGEYINDISRRSICNMYHDVKQRFSTRLLMLEDRSGQETLNLTHEQSARSLGIYRPSLTMVAIALRASGAIGYSRGELVIRNRAALETEACVCYTKLATAF